jgi:DNA-binding transcriptional LysR family regulator
MNVELRHLRYFLAVAEELHFGRAAERLGIAQPPLSQQIRKLEEEIGAQLFHRSTRRVALSPAGEAMLPFARQALVDVSAGIEVARRGARGETGTLTVGFIGTAARTVLPGAVRHFRAAHPEVNLTLRELAVDDQVARLRSEELDIAIVRPPVDGQDLLLKLLFEERLIVAVAESHRFAAKHRLAPRTLEGEPLVLLAREIVPGLHDQVIALFEKQRMTAWIAQEATSIQAVLGLVSGGLGISLLPGSVSHWGRTGLAFVSLAPSPRLPMLVASRKGDRSPLTRNFLTALRKSTKTARSQARPTTSGRDTTTNGIVER